MLNPDTSISEFVPLSTHVSPSVVKTVDGDYLMTWYLGGLPFVGREEWDLEHRHNTFNRMLQTLRAPDFTNLAFWVHDVRRKRRISDHSRFTHAFNQGMSDAYFAALSSQKIMQNELYLTMIYRPIVTGKRMMIAHVHLKKGDDVPRHEHDNEQLTYILEGSLRLWFGANDEREITVRAGEVVVIPSNVPHRALALEDTLDVDVFSPPREDWLAGTDAYLRR